MNKRKIFKIVFLVSFLPYIILILISSYHAFWGYDLYTWVKPYYIETIYGIDAFKTTLFWNLIWFSVIPILPISLIIQIIYIIKYIIKRKKEKKDGI